MKRLLLVYLIFLSENLVASQLVKDEVIGVVSSAHPLATQAAELIYGKGGNAVDAAVAASFVLSVVEPTMSGLGGRAQALVRSGSGKFFGYNGMTEIPRSFVKRENMPDSGYSTVATPGLVGLLWNMHDQHGVLPFKVLVDPAIKVAEEGFLVLPGEAARQKSSELKISTNKGMKTAFFQDGGSVTNAGKMLRQPVLAKTLQKISYGGVDTFYRGEIAQIMATDILSHGGFVSQEDLSSYKVLPGRYISFAYRDFLVHTLAAPAGGGLVIKALMLMNHFDLAGLDDPRWAVVISQALAISIESMSHNYYERDLDILVNSVWAEEHHKRIILPKVRYEPIASKSSLHSSSETDWIGYAGAHTSHFATADCSGMTVSMTQTLGPIFGAKVATPSLGFAYAATMGGYLRTGPQVPGERPRTAIAPVIVTRGDSVVMALGAAGGIRIPSAIVQTISRFVDQGKNLSEAVAAPRVHPLTSIDKNDNRVIDLQSFNAEISYPGWTSENLEYWRLNGFNVTETERNASFGRIHATLSSHSNLFGVADPDWEGTASTQNICLHSL
jgi:gamma-glutamyltranspeptidase/glutathione hydrolase